VRTVKEWVALGKEAGDPVPLDDGSALAAWWVRHMKHRVPDAILRAAAAGKPLLELPVVVPPAEKAADPVAEVSAEESSEVELPVLAEELGLEKTLERLAQMEVRLSRKAHEPGQTKAWLDTVQRMTTVAQQLRVEATRLGNLLPKDLVEEAIHALHGPIEREIRLLYPTLCQVMGLPASPDREAQWSAEVDRIFVRFNEKVLR
jgi:hypothetical protein